MFITPESELYLLQVPLNINNKHQLTFNSKKEQENYFLNLPTYDLKDDSDDKFSYIRKDKFLSYPRCIDQIEQYNYIMYRNKESTNTFYKNKWVYAYIIGMQYAGENCTKIIIKTDVWQTWQFDLQFMQSFIEREHLSKSEDIAGANLIPEGLEIGEITVNSESSIDGLEPIYCIAFNGTPRTFEKAPKGTILNGIFNGLCYVYGNAQGMKELLESLVDDGHHNKIVSIFTLPALAVKTLTNSIPDIITTKESWFIGNFIAQPLEIDLISRPNTLDGYTPKNKKLLTYPYLYIGLTALNSTNKIYRYEDFENATPKFNMMSEINPNPNIIVLPRNYKNVDKNVSESGIITGYPQVSWVEDYFSSWLAQNQNIMTLNMEQQQYNYEIDVIKSGISQATKMFDIVGAGTNPAGFISDTANWGLSMQQAGVNQEYYIKNQMAQIEKQQMIPNTTHMGTSGTALGYDLIQKQVFSRFSIKKQFAERIDKYFDMFGYSTNTVKIPNIKNRSNWNYIKTIGCNIKANIPQNDLIEIIAMFDSGITLWHNNNNFGDYSQNNI